MRTSDLHERPTTRRTFLKRSHRPGGCGGLAVDRSRPRIGSRRHRWPPASASCWALSASARAASMIWSAPSCRSRTCSSWPSATCGPADAKRSRPWPTPGTATGIAPCIAIMFELLARPDIDAVLIATGDRWHALGFDPVDEGRQARLQREALRDDDRPLPGRGRNGAPLRARVPGRHAAADGLQFPDGRPAWPTAESWANSAPCTLRATNPRFATIGFRPSPSRPRTSSIGTAGWGRRPGGRTTEPT